MNTQRCPSCGRVVVLRSDGTPGRHFTHERKSQERLRCPAGERLRKPAPTGRRVTVALDVVVPSEWTLGEYRQMLRDLLLRHSAEGFVVDIAVSAKDGAA